MRRLAGLLLLAFPLFAQLPTGVERRPYPTLYPRTEPTHLTVTADGLLWGAPSRTNVLDRIDPNDGAAHSELPFAWSGTYDLITGPDGAVWLGTRKYLARHDRTTGRTKTWTQFSSAIRLLSGSDGNLWFLQVDDSANRVGTPRFTRLSLDGVVLERFRPGNVRGAVFASDGALWYSADDGGSARLVRRTLAGEQTQFSIEQASELFAGPGFLWTAFNDRIVRLDLQGTVIGTYRIAMTPVAADALGNLWLRTGTEVAQLTPGGVLTRFAPLPALPSNRCFPPQTGPLAFLPDGRIAMTDFYPANASDACEPAEDVYDPSLVDTLTILDPALAPVASIEQLNPVPRRRSQRRQRSARGIPHLPGQL